MITRDLAIRIKRELGKRKVIVLIGPRQVGKTTLLNAIVEDI
jgi:predicted AAA+ superfamily ATPase